MARRQPNYNFERKQREEKKAAKKQAKRDKARARKDGQDDELQVSRPNVTNEAETEN